jgi:penicillin-binding protein 1A
MASKRRQARARREPVFDKASDLHVSAEDRSAPADDKSRARSGWRRPRRRRGRLGKRNLIGRIAYWSLVAGLWLAIGAAGFVAWVGAHLPPIQSLEIPKRAPSIQIVDFQGRALARRGDLAGAPLPL